MKMKKKIKIKIKKKIMMKIKVKKRKEKRRKIGSGADDNCNKFYWQVFIQCGPQNYKKWQFSKKLNKIRK